MLDDVALKNQNQNQNQNPVNDKDLWFEHQKI
jgi:hypothetical protein